MSNVIDNRVVQMQFDNAAFEKGVKTTTDSLANLDKTIDQVVSGNNTGKLGNAFSNLLSRFPFESLQNAAGGVATAIGNIFSETAHQVSTLSKIGLGTITAMGAAVTALAATGGMRRALNIEQAKFQLDGLGVAWEKIYDDLDYAVAGTAYGLDSAAKAASQLVASNVKVGDSMKTALRGISGVAAMTNREYDEVAHIFTTVAGTGRLMGMQLTQLGTYGINAASAIAKYFREVRGEADVTEETIRDMTSKGSIDFQTFAEAMDWNYGEHAKAANDTFTGAMANTKAALSRIGAEFATPYMENMKDVFNALIPFLNMIKKSMTPLFTEFSSVMESGKKAVVDFLEPFTGLEYIEQEGTGVVNEINRTAESITNLSGIFQKLIDMGHYVGNIFGESFKAMSEGLAETWGIDKLPQGYKFLESIFDSIKDFDANVLQKLDLSRFFDALLGPIWVEGIQLKQIFDTVKSSLSGLDLATVFNGFVDVVEVFGHAVEFCLTVWNAFIQAGIEMAAPVIQDVAKLFHDFAMAFDEVFRGDAEYAPVLDTILGLINGLKDGFLEWYGTIRNLIPTVGDFTSILSVFKDVFSTIGDFLGGNLQKFSDFVHSIAGPLGSEETSNGISQFAQVLRNLGDAIHTLLEESGIISMVERLGGAVSSLALGDVMSVLGGGMIVQGLRVIHNLLNKIQGDVSKIAKWDDPLAWLRIGGAGPAINEIKTAFISLQGALNAKAVGEIAKSLLLMSAAMIVLSLVPFDKLVAGGVAMAFFMQIMSKSMTALTSDFKMTQMQSVGLVAIIGGISAAILAMSVAMKLLSTIDAAHLITSAIAMFVLIKSLVAVVSTMGETTNPGALAKGSGMLRSLGVSILAMSLAMKLLSTIDAPGIVSALIGMGMILATMASIILVLDTVSNAKSLSSAALMFATIGGAFVLMAASMKILSTIDTEGAKVAIASMAVLFAGLAGVMAVLKVVHFSSLLASAAVFTTIGLALVAMAVSFKMLSTISGTGLASSVLSLISTIALLGVAVALLGSLGAKALVGSAAILAISTSILLLAPALVALSVVPTVGLISAIAALSALITVIAVAATLGSTAGLLALAAALTGIGLAALMFGAGIGILVAGFGVLVIAVAALIEAVTVLGSAFVGSVSNFAAAMGKFIVELAKELATHGDELADSGSKIIKSLLKTLTNSLEAFVDFGFQMILAILQGIERNIDDVVSAALGIIASFLVGLASGIGKIVDAAWQIAIMFVKGLADGFRNNRKMMELAVTDLMNTLGMAFLEGIAALLQGVPIFGEELAAGVREQAGKLEEAADEAAAALDEKFKEHNAEILANTEQTMDATVDAVEESKSELSSESASASSSMTEQFASKLGLDKSMMENLGLTENALESHIPVLSGLSGKSGSEVVNSFSSSTSKLPNIAEDVSQDTADAIGSVDYSDPGEDNGLELTSSTAEGIEDTSYLPEDAASKSMLSTIGAAITEADKNGATPGHTFTTKVAKAIDEHGSDDESKTMMSNATKSAVDEAGFGGSAGAKFGDSVSGGILQDAANQSAVNLVNNAIASANSQADYSGSAGGKFGYNVAGGVDQNAADWAASNLVSNAITSAGNTNSDPQGRTPYSIGANIVQGLINGMNSLADSVWNYAVYIGSLSTQGIANGSVVQSPSKLTTETGYYVTKGLILGMKSLESQAVETAEEIGYNTAFAMGNFSSIIDGIDWDANPTITPVLDTSLVESGLGALDGFFATSQARQAGWASGNYSIAFGSNGNNQNGGNTNNVTVQLNYDAGADANELVLGIARALRTTAIMEG